jgi:hypothetical protein
MRRVEGIAILYATEWCGFHKVVPFLGLATIDHYVAMNPSEDVGCKSRSA